MQIMFCGEFVKTIGKKQLDIVLDKPITLKELVYVLMNQYSKLKEVLPMDCPESWENYMIAVIEGKVYKVNDYVSNDSCVTICPPLEGG